MPFFDADHKFLGNIVSPMMRSFMTTEARDESDNENEDLDFHDACAEGRLDVVQSLVQRGFDMNIANPHGGTGFHEACISGHTNVVKFLLSKGFDMNHKDNYGTTGFFNACGCGKLNVVQFLVQKGYVNIGDNEVKLGFHEACFYGKLKVVQFFIEHGFEDVHELETGLNILIQERYTLSDDELFMPCILQLIEFGVQLNKVFVFEELISVVESRIIEITFIKEIIFSKWSGRIARAITDFTMDSFTNTSLKNLSKCLN